MRTARISRPAFVFAAAFLAFGLLTERAAAQVRQTSTSGAQQQRQQQTRGQQEADPNCAVRADDAEIRVCHWGLARRREIALYPKETLRVTILDANPLIYSYDVVGEPFVEDQSARDAFRTLFAVRSATPPAGPRAFAGDNDATKKCAERKGTPVENFDCFTTAIQEAAQMLIGAVRETDLSRETTPENARAQSDEIKEDLADFDTPIRSFLASEATLATELEARFRALPTTPMAEQQARYTAARSAAAGVTRFWHELEQLYLGPLTRVYNFEGSTNELVRLRIRNRLGDAYTPIRPLSDGGIALATLKPAPHGFEFSTGLAFVMGDRVNFTTSKLAGDTLLVRADTTGDLSIPPSLFLSHLWHLGGANTLGLTFGAGVKDLSQIENSTDILGGLTLGREWFRLTLGGAYTSEIRSIPGLDAQNRTTDANILSRATRERKLRPFFSIHGKF